MRKNLGRLGIALGLSAMLLAAGPAAASMAAPPATALGTAGPASSDLTSNAARSVVVNLQNNTGCVLVLTKAVVYHGVWIPGGYPPSHVYATPNVEFGSESNGFMTGTEAEVAYDATSCADPHKYGTVYIHWTNPYIGSNTYSLYTSAGGLKADYNHYTGCCTDAWLQAWVS
jgi:hypothetical protein